MLQYIAQWQAMQDFYLAIGFQLEFERDNSLMSLSLKNVNNDTGKAATFWDDGVSLILKVTTVMSKIQLPSCAHAWTF